MTRNARPDPTRTDDEQTLADVSHTNPATGRTFGGNFTFARGGAVAADGGAPDVVPEDDDDADGDDVDDEDVVVDAETLEDVEHTPPNESEDANRVFERGDEAGAPVEDE